jgi:hypothetical protein
MPTEIALATLLDLEGNELCSGRVSVETGAERSWRGRFTSYSGDLRRFSVGPGSYLLRIDDSLYRVVLSRPFSYRPSATIAPPEIVFSSLEAPPAVE